MKWDPRKWDSWDSLIQTRAWDLFTVIFVLGACLWLGATIARIRPPWQWPTRTAPPTRLVYPPPLPAIPARAPDVPGIIVEESLIDDLVWRPQAFPLAPLWIGTAREFPFYVEADRPPAFHREVELACLRSDARALLARIESEFGRMSIVSTCRPGATIAGTGHPSLHRYGRAIDFDAGAQKEAVVAWLIANHKSGGTMTYADMSHIHVDIGKHFVSLAHKRSQRHHARRRRDDEAGAQKKWTQKSAQAHPTSNN